MSGRKKLIFGGIALVLVAIIVLLALTGSSGTSNASEVIVFSKVQQRPLKDTVSLQGTLSRKQIRNVSASSAGILSSISAKNGTTMTAGQTLFSLNGRNAIAEVGTVPFFRPLSLGDQGEDVLQLKKILASSGDYPGNLNNYFTQGTEYALAQWQAQHHYPNSTPATAQAVNVSLGEGTAYKLGPQTSAGLVIQPPAAQTAADVQRTGTVSNLGVGGGIRATELTATVSRLRPQTTPATLTIQSVSSEVTQGTAAAFVITSSKALGAPLTINMAVAGTAGPQDIISPPATAVLAAGLTQTTYSVQTRVNTVVETNPTITASINGGTGYVVGSPASATTTIKNQNTPALHITGGTTIAPGGAVTLTVTANTPPIQNTQIELSVQGSASPGADYNPVNPLLTLPAGHTSATITISTVPQHVIEPKKYLIVSITPVPGQYTVTTPGSAVIGISQPATVPSVTITSSVTYLPTGQPYEVTLSLSEAVSSSLVINLSYGGTAIEGVDYDSPKGVIVIPAGQTQIQVPIPTVSSNTVEPNRILTVNVVPGAGYAVGSPSSASVTLNSSVVPQLTLVGTTSSVTQGGAATFTIVANQAPVKNTSINFSVQGTVQPGQGYVPVTGTALLLAGQRSVTVTVQSLQTNVAFEPTDMVVGTWPTRIGTVYLKSGAPAATGEAILSLTQPNLSVTLQATAAERSKLKVGQPCTVQIAGETNTGTGTITSLNSTPTATGSGASTSQVYEGQIEVANFTGANGSQVSINVTDKDIPDALTVPISAVLQNGSGKSVVRVIDLTGGGKVHEVPVTTGLSEGSYIQITKGLHLTQVVISQVNQTK